MPNWGAIGSTLGNFAKELPAVKGYSALGKGLYGLTKRKGLNIDSTEDGEANISGPDAFAPVVGPAGPMDYLNRKPMSAMAQGGIALPHIPGVSNPLKGLIPSIPTGRKDLAPHIRGLHKLKPAAAAAEGINAEGSDPQPWDEQFRADPSQPPLLQSALAPDAFKGLEDTVRDAPSGVEANEPFAATASRQDQTERQDTPQEQFAVGAPDKDNEGPAKPVAKKPSFFGLQPGGERFNPNPPHEYGTDPNSGEAIDELKGINLAKSLEDYKRTVANEPVRPKAGLGREILGGLAGWGIGMFAPGLGRMVGSRIAQGDYAERMGDYNKKVADSEKQIGLEMKAQDQLTKQQKEKDFATIQANRYTARTTEAQLIRDLLEARAKNDTEGAAKIQEELRNRKINEQKAIINFKSNATKMANLVPIPEDQREMYEALGVAPEVVEDPRQTEIDPDTGEEVPKKLLMVNRHFPALVAQSVIRGKNSPLSKMIDIIQANGGKDAEDNFLISDDEAQKLAGKTMLELQQQQIAAGKSKLDVQKAQIQNYIAHAALANRSPGTGAGGAGMNQLYSPFGSPTGGAYSGAPMGPAAAGGASSTTTPVQGPPPNTLQSGVVMLGGKPYTRDTIPAIVPIDWVPEEYRGQVKALLNIDAKPMTVSSRANPYTQALIYWTRKVNPAWDDTSYGQKWATKQDYAKGQPAKLQRGANTLIEHLSTLHDALKTLDNGTLRRYNTVGNWLLQEGGSPRLKPAKLAMTAAQEELASLLKGGVPSVDLEKAFRDIFNMSDSPAAAQQAVTTAADLMKGRAEPLEQFYLDKVGQPLDKPLLSAKSQKLLTKMGVAYTPIAKGVDASAAPTAPTPANKIRVRNKATGQTGTILPADFNDAKYERL